MKTSTLLRFGHVAARYQLTGQRAPLNTMIALTEAGCGKGELSADGGFVESGADANIARERRFIETP